MNYRNGVLLARLAPGADVLPNGLAINGLRAVVYFHGAAAGTAFLGLAEPVPPMASSPGATGRAESAT